MMQRTFQAAGQSWRARHVLAPFLFFSALTTFMTWPLPARMADSLFGFPGDNFYFLWLVGWYREAILQHGVSPLWVPLLNYPEGFALAYNEVTPATALLAWTPALLFGDTFGYNFANLLSFALAGLATYLWAYRLTRSQAPSLLAGMLFTFTPEHFARLGGHPTLVMTQWMAFYFLSLHAMLAARRATIQRMAVAGFFLGMLALTGQYLLYMSLVLTPVYVAVFALVAKHPAVRDLRWWLRLGGLGAAALPLAALGVAPYVELVMSGRGPAPRLVPEVQQHGASLTDFIAPTQMQLLVGWQGRDWLTPLVGPVVGEHGIYLGTVALALAAAVIFLPVRRRVETRLLAVTALVAVVLAMGVSLNIGGETVTVDVPSWLQPWHPYSRTFIPMPGYLLYRILPFYGSMRIWARYAIFVSLCVSLLAALGAHGVLQRVRRSWRTPLATAFVLLVLCDFHIGYLPLLPAQGRPVDGWLAAQPGQGAVVQLPLWQSYWRGTHIYYTTIHGKPFVGANFGAFYSPQAKWLTLELERFPDQRSADALRAIGAAYILMDPTDFEDFSTVRAQLEPLGLRLLTVSGETYVYGFGSQ